MKQRWILLFALTVVIGAPALSAAADNNDAKRPTTSTTKTGTTGDQIFQANCSRCHMPPMSISPRTTGTVLMHMRTRARLSREDELKLLRFMAP